MIEKINRFSGEVDICLSILTPVFICHCPSGVHSAKLSLPAY